MGQSTDAILFFGYCWTEETDKPWKLGNDDDDDDDDDREARLARLKGLVHPTDPYPETRDPRTGKQFDLSPDKAAIVAKYKAYWGAKNAIVEASGCVVATHCSSECPMPFVAVKASLTKAWRGDPQEISSIEVSPGWKQMLDEFCATLGIKTYGMKAGWWLVSDWG